MKVERIDHIHIAIKNLEEAASFFSSILGTEFMGPIDHGNMRVAFNDIGLELICPSDPEHPFTRRMGKMPEGEGLFSIGLKVPNLEEALAELETKGIKCLRKNTSLSDLKTAQIDPADTHGVWIELVEYKTVPPVVLANMSKVKEIPTFRNIH